MQKKQPKLNNPNWRKLKTNYVLNFDGFYISYNPMEIINEPETALVVNHKDKQTEFFILMGDHRKGYEDLKTLKECKAYFKKHKDEISFWSN